MAIIINSMRGCIIEHTLPEAEVGSELEADSGRAAPAGGSLAGGAQLGAGSAPSSPRSFISALCTEPQGVCESTLGMQPWAGGLRFEGLRMWPGELRGETQNTEVTGWNSRIFPSAMAAWH